MTQVAARVQTQVSSDGARGCLERVGGPQQTPATGDHTLALPHRGHYGSAHHVLNERLKEGLPPVLLVVTIGNLRQLRWVATASRWNYANRNIIGTLQTSFCLLF